MPHWRAFSIASSVARFMTKWPRALSPSRSTVPAFSFTIRMLGRALTAPSWICFTYCGKRNTPCASAPRASDSAIKRATSMASSGGIPAETSPRVMKATISAIKTPGWSDADFAVSLMIVPPALNIFGNGRIVLRFLSRQQLLPFRVRLWHVLKDHQMGFFDHQVRKHRSLPSGGFVALGHALRDIQFLQQVDLQVLCPVARRNHVMSRDSRIEPFQFRHPQYRVRYGPGRYFSEKLEMVRILLLKHGNRAGRPHEVNPSGRRVILKIICTADTVEPLNYFSRLCIDHSQSARFMLVPPSDVSRMCDQSATDKQPMMGRVETRGMRHRPSGDGPLLDHGALFKVNHRNM